MSGEQKVQAGQEMMMGEGQQMPMMQMCMPMMKQMMGQGMMMQDMMQMTTDMMKMQQKVEGVKPAEKKAMMKLTPGSSIYYRGFRRQSRDNLGSRFNRR